MVLVLLFVCGRLLAWFCVGCVTCGDLVTFGYCCDFCIGRRCLCVATVCWCLRVELIGVWVLEGYGCDIVVLLIGCVMVNHFLLCVIGWCFWWVWDVFTG